ncbi:MAG: sigma-70 family RNA polymerase sigma factor [Baekduia sp.]
MARARFRRGAGTDLATLADEELIELVGHADERAFEAIYDRHSAVAYSLAYRMTGAPGPAQDITQEAFLSLWRGYMRFDPSRGSLRTWLLGIVRNRAIDVLRKQAPDRRRLVHGDEIAERMPSQASTEDEAVARIGSAELRSELGRLPGEQRQALELAYFGAFSQSEIAEMLNVPIGTIKGRMRLGLTKLRTRVPEEAYDR